MSLSLRVRGMLGVGIPLVVAFVVMLGLVERVLDAVGREEARGWFEGAAQRSIPDMSAVTFAGLDRLSWFLADAVTAERETDTARASDYHRLLAHQQFVMFSLRNGRGELVGGDDCAALPTSGAAPARGFVRCGGSPAFALSTRVGSDTLTLYRLIESTYLEYVAQVIQAELVLLDERGVTYSSLRDADGRSYSPVFADTGDWDPRPRDGNSFGTATLTGGTYAGFPPSQLAAGESHVACYVLSTEVPGLPYWIILVVPEIVLNLGRLYAWRIIAAGMLVVMALLLLYVAAFARRVTIPLARLAEATRRVERGDLHATVDVDGHDELAQLGHAFNHMTVALRENRRRLAELSRIGGMAEVATGVLHNVGNVLNSVNVSVDLLTQQVKGLRTEALVQAGGLLEREGHDLPRYLGEDPRGKLLPQYLARVARSLHGDRERILTEAARLRTNVERIRSIVVTQQVHARTVRNPTVERIDTVVGDAIALVRPAIESREVVLVTRFADIAPFSMEAQRVSQILVNLLGNAVDAVAGEPAASRIVEVSTARVDRAVHVVVTDRGVGIASEQLDKIFAFGHTTKPGGHGFALHMSALVARTLGGSLSCHSDGVGRGARFTLVIPMSD
jgi:signal transduction histidine kinase